MEHDDNTMPITPPRVCRRRMAAALPREFHDAGGAGGSEMTGEVEQSEFRVVGAKVEKREVREKPASMAAWIARAESQDRRLTTLHASGSASAGGIMT